MLIIKSTNYIYKKKGKARMSELMNVMNGVKKNLDNKYTLGKVYYNDICG